MCSIHIEAYLYICVVFTQMDTLVFKYPVLTWRFPCVECEVFLVVWRIRLKAVCTVWHAPVLRFAVFTFGRPLCLSVQNSHETNLCVWVHNIHFGPCHMFECTAFAMGHAPVFQCAVFTLAHVSLFECTGFKLGHAPLSERASLQWDQYCEPKRCPAFSFSKFIIQGGKTWSCIADICKYLHWMQSINSRCHYRACYCSNMSSRAFSCPS
jgi:hypothetical protein